MVWLLAWLLGAPVGGVAYAAPPPVADVEADGAALQAALVATAVDLDREVSSSRGVLLGLTSVSGDYARYRKIEAVDRKISEARDAVHAVNALWPVSVSMAERLEALSESDRKALFGRNQSDADDYAAALRDRLDRWTQARTEIATKLNDAAREDLDQAASMMASPDTQASGLGHMEMWIIGFHSRMLDAIDVILPEEDLDGEPVALTQAERLQRERTRAIRTEIQAVFDKVAAVKAANEAARQAKVAAARFPDGDAPSEAGVRAALEAEFGPALRMAKVAPWMVREEAYWVRGRWYVGTYKYLSVWLAAKSPSGKTLVYRTQVVSKKEGGAWGPIRYRGVADSFEMLEQNLR